MSWSRAKQQWTDCLDRYHLSGQLVNTGIKGFSEVMQQLSSCFFPSLIWTCVIQSRAACTPPRRKPLESDFETIKLISNGAYGWVRQASVFCARLTQWLCGQQSPIKAEKKLKMRMCSCSIFVFTLRICLGNFISSLNWCSLVSDVYVSSSFFPPSFPCKISQFIPLLTCHPLINPPIPVCPVMFLLSLLLPSSLTSPALQGCISGAPQGDPSTFCHEEDQPAEPDS